MGVVSCTTSPCGIHFSLSVFLSYPSSFYTSTLGGSPHQLLSCYRSGNHQGNFFPTGYRLISSSCTSNQGDNPQNEVHLSSFFLSCTIDYETKTTQIQKISVLFFLFLKTLKKKQHMVAQQVTRTALSARQLSSVFTQG